MTGARRPRCYTTNWDLTLDRLRQGWLNPPDRPYDLTDRELARRTLTNLYNERPTWLQDAHARLDAAVLDAYGWPHDIADEHLLAQLLALNLERDPAPAGRTGAGLQPGSATR